MRSMITPILAIIVTCTMMAQTHVVYTGRVVDSASGDGIAGASIRVEGTTKGTYSRSGGAFRLPLPPGTHTLRVRSIGYGEVTVRIDETQNDMRIALPVSEIEKGSVTVQAEITPEEVIRRAIARKRENAARIRTLERSLYSKMRVEMNNQGLLSDDNDDVAAITETFSTVYEQRQPTPTKKQTVIVQRRQTRNIPAASNLSVFDEEYDFTDDEFVLLNVRLVTPLSTRAVDEYVYTIINKRPIGRLIAYEMAFEPRSRLFPGFEGTLTIVDGTYQVIAATFAPTQETAFPFVKGFKQEMRYEQVADGVWVPAYQQISGDVRLKIIAGLADFTVHATAQSWLQEAKVNHDIADTIFKQRDRQTRSITLGASSDGTTSASATADASVSVLPDADSARSEYWEQHAFAEMSTEERQIYRTQDSIMSDSTRARRRSAADRPRTIGSFPVATIGDVAIGVTPVMDRTTVTGVMYGGELEVAGGPVNMQGVVAFGKQETRIGSAGITVRVLDTGGVRLDVAAQVFSTMTTVQAGRSVLQRFSNLNLNNLLYADYMDFYRHDGFDVGFSATSGKFTFAMLGASSRHFVMPLVEAIDREAVVPDEGDYRTLHATLSIGEPDIIENALGTAWPVYGSITGGYGQEQRSGLSFHSFSTTIGTRIPTISVGYHPMQLDVTVIGGWASAATPRQFQYSALKRYPFFGSNTDLATVPVNRLGGTEFLSAHAEHNFTDLWWRAVGLPTYNGRGIDLIGAISAASYVQRGLPLATAFRSTNGWYAEAGFSVARIPTFISDLFFLRFDARWPIGPVAVPIGSFGWNITVSSPLL